MLLFVVLINDPSFLLSSRRKRFSISSLISSKQLFFVSGRISPQVLRCFNKPTTSLCFSLLIFQQLHSILSLQGCIPSSFVAEIVIFLSAPLSQQCSFPFICSGGMVMLLSSSYHLVLPRSCSFLCLSIQPECCMKYFLPLVPFFQ